VDRAARRIAACTVAQTRAHTFRLDKWWRWSLRSRDGASSWYPVDTGEALARSGVEAGRGYTSGRPARPQPTISGGNAGVIQIDTHDEANQVVDPLIRRIRPSHLRGLRKNPTADHPGRMPELW
jgi:hypothetical protein